MTGMKDDAGPAFPPTFGLSGEIGTGMTLRDWFAGQALAGIMANPETWLDSDGVLRAGKIAYARADAMMEARK
ncbi:MAG: hypothetical protein U5N55_04775 [Cypionkella sp.]|nr:hypothetical protein [Cypionkella sp.]